LDSFNLWNKSKSEGLMSGLQAREVTLPTRIYLANRSQPSPWCGRALSCKMSGPSPSKTGWFCAFSAQFLHPVTIIRCCYTCFKWNSICHDDSSVIMSKNHNLLDLWLRSAKFFGSRGGWTSPLVWLWFQLQFKVSNPCFKNSDNSKQECLTFNVKSLFQ
jgi:hypothetical protein